MVHPAGIRLRITGRVQGVGYRAFVEDRARASRLEGWVRNRRDGSVEALATRLGIGPRHLDRLFQRRLAASPVQVAQTIRVQRAKRLLDTTDWPMTAIALQAGFGSLRRFNAAFAAIYRRPPSDVRRRGTADRRSA